MSKKTIIWISLSILIIAGISYYIYKKVYDSSNLLKYVPGNASVVFTADFKSLSGKISMEKLKTMNFYQSLKKEMDNSRSDDTKMMKRLINEPMSLGINLFKDMFLFVTERNDREVVGIVFEVSDSDDFEDFVKAIPNVEALPQQINNYKTLEIDSRSLIAWNDEAAIILTEMGRGKEKYADELMYQKHEESLAANKAFTNNIINPHDFAAFVTYEGLESMMESEFGKTPDELKFHGSSLYMSLNFGANDLTIDANLTDLTGKLTDKIILHDKSTTDKLINYLTASDYYAGASLSVNMERLWNTLSETDDFENTMSEITSELGVTKNELENFYTGEFAGSITGFKMIEKKYNSYDYNPYTYAPIITEKSIQTLMPEFVIAAGAKQNGVFEKIMNKAKAIYSGSYWQFDSGEGFVLYAIQMNDNVIMTNSEDVISQLSKNGSLSSSVPKFAEAGMTKNPAFAYLNVNTTSYPEIFQNYLRSEFGNRVYETVAKTTKSFEGISFSGGQNHGSLKLSLTESDEGSLMRIISLLDDIQEPNYDF